MPSPAHHTPLTADAVESIDVVKKVEADLLSRLVDFAADGADPRWLAIARTNLEIGFMTLIRSIAQGEKAAA